MENLRGCLWMTIAMASFAVEDMFIKFALRHLSLGEVLMIYAAAGLPILWLVAKVQGETFDKQLLTSPIMLLRSCLEVCGRLGHALAVSLIAIATASAILQATPLVMLAGASVLLGDRMSLGGWAALFMGFVGVIVIIQPGSPDMLNIGVGFSIFGMLGFAGRDLLTRFVPANVSVTSLTILSYSLLFAIGAGLMIKDQSAFVFEGMSFVYAALSGVTGICSYMALMLALRTGDVRVVVPLRYTRAIFATLIGVWVFSEVVSWTTLLGVGMVILSGTYALYFKPARAPSAN
jgi:drug/metabolite transporter (DMT)-like permease